MKPRVIVFGIDGASHSFIQHLISKKKLPTFEKFVTEGFFSSLQSTFPPHTAPGWASMFTGVNPGKHGIFQFWHTQSQHYNPPITTIEDFKWEPIWRTLERHGYQVGLLNVPMTHPPKPINGYMITWPLTPTLHYSEPKSLIKELAKNGLHYQSDLMTMYRYEENYLEKALEYIKNRTKTIKYLLEHHPTDALFVVYTELDRISHYYWGSQALPSSKVEEAYIAMDQALSEIMDCVPSDTLFIIASDHGFGHCRYNLNVQKFLEQHGLLQTHLVEINTHKNEFLNVSSDTQKANWHTSPTLYQKQIHWDKTLAYMPTPGCFGINLNKKWREEKGIIDSPKQALSVSQQITEIFKTLIDPDDGSQVFEVLDKRKFYHGHCIDSAPDLILYPYKWDIMPHPAISEDLWAIPTQPAIHRMDGILLGKGPFIQGAPIRSPQIEDVTSLILAQLSLPLQEGIDGHWLFEPSSPLQYEPRIVTTTTENTLTKEQQKLMENQLANLGYM